MLVVVWIVHLIKEVDGESPRQTALRYKRMLQETGQGQKCRNKSKSHYVATLCLYLISENFNLRSLTRISGGLSEQRVVVVQWWIQRNKLHQRDSMWQMFYFGLLRQQKKKKDDFPNTDEWVKRFITERSFSAVGLFFGFLVRETLTKLWKMVDLQNKTGLFKGHQQ